MPLGVALMPHVVLFRVVKGSQEGWHTGSMKSELKCTGYNMSFCVRVHVTQIIALWNRKENPSQFKLMTWLLFWSGWGFIHSFCLLLLHKVSAWGPAFLHCSQRAWPRPNEENETVAQKEECDCTRFFTLCIFLLFSFLFFPFLENVLQKRDSSPFLGKQTPLKKWPKLCLKMSINGKTLQKCRDPQILWSPCRPPVTNPVFSRDIEHGGRTGLSGSPDRY